MRSVSAKIASCFLSCAVLLILAPSLQSEPAKSAYAHDLVLTGIMGYNLNPPVYLPAGSHVDNVFMNTGTSQGVKGQQLITYEASSPLSWKATYQYYRSKYKSNKVRWQGSFKGNDFGPSYLFFVQEDPAAKIFTMFSVEEDARGSKPDIDPVSAKYRHSTFILVGVNVPFSRVFDFQQKNSSVDFPMPS